MRTYRPLATRLRTRRRFAGGWGEHLIADRAPRPGGFVGVPRDSRPPRHAHPIGPGERAGQRMARRGPLGPTSQIADEASAPAGATAPAQRQGDCRHAPAGSRTPTREPAGRTISLGMFDCPSCGQPIGRGHADDCPSRTRRAELVLCLAFFTFAGAIALWLRAPELTALCGVLDLVSFAAYRPPRDAAHRRSDRQP